MGCVLSQMFDAAVEGAVLYGGAGTRYVAPILVFLAILAARAMPELITSLPTRRFRFALVSLLVALSGGLLIGRTATAARLVNTKPAVTRSPFAEAARWLKAHRLTCGVGEYWTSSIITALSSGKVTVRAAIAPPGGLLRPFLFIADARWYRPTEAPTFVIWRDGDPSSFNVNERTVAESYGVPARIEQVAGFKIAVLSTPPASQGLRVTCASED